MVRAGAGGSAKACKYQHLLLTDAGARGRGFSWTSLGGGRLILHTLHHVRKELGLSNVTARAQEHSPGGLEEDPRGQSEVYVAGDDVGPEISSKGESVAPTSSHPHGRRLQNEGSGVVLLLYGPHQTPVSIRCPRPFLPQHSPKGFFMGS